MFKCLIEIKHSQKKCHRHRILWTEQREAVSLPSQPIHRFRHATWFLYESDTACCLERRRRTSFNLCSINQTQTSAPYKTGLIERKYLHCCTAWFYTTNNNRNRPSLRFHYYSLVTQKLKSSRLMSFHVFLFCPSSIAIKMADGFSRFGATALQKKKNPKHKWNDNHHII